MARQKNIDEPKKPVGETRPATTRQAYFSTAPARGWLYGLVTAVVLILVFLAGIGVADHRHGVMAFRSNKIGGPVGRFGFQRGFRGLGDSVTMNGQTRARGVVTSVNDNGFTIAGNGSTTNVVTNSSTRYQDGNQVKQNDSVIVLGTTSNGTLTASQIVINP